MAKKDLQLNVTAEAEQAIQAMAKMIDKQEVMINKLSKMNREGSGAGKSITSGMLAVAGGFGIATSAGELFRQTLGLIVKEIEDLRRKESEAQKTTADYAKTFSTTIGQWLGAGMIDKAHVALTKIAKEIPSLSPASAQAILSAYAGTKARAKIEPEAELARSMEVVKLVAPLTYAKEETVKIIGELEEIFPKKTTEDIADLAVGIQKRAGRHREEIEGSMKAIRQMITEGFSPEKALSIMMAAFGEEQGTKTLTTIARLPELFGQEVKRTPGEPFTEEQKIQRETAGMNPEQILQWVIDNPEKAKKIIGPQQWVGIAPVMKPGVIETQAGEIKKIQTGDEYQKELEDQQKSALASEVRLAENRAAAEQWVKLKNTKGATAGFARKSAEDLLKSMPGIGKTERDLILAAVEINGRIGGDYAAAAVKRLTSLQQRFGEPMLPGGYTTQFDAAYGPRQYYQPSTKNIEYNPELAEQIGVLIKDILEKVVIEKAMSRLNQGEQGDPVVKELQQVNKLLQKTLTELSRPDLALRMVGINSGMVD
ncbi:MAG: hypothetical protein PHY02_06315 [Phycisphaerae bacterium]|nr:hypothetical protein [Phycisphaerae bacterium]